MAEEQGSRAKDIMNYSFLVAFANDGTLDDGEIRFMKGLALKDGVIDEAEKSVFRKIFWRLTEDKVSAEAWIELTKFREEYDI